MEFIKKNTIKIIFALLVLFVFVFMTILTFNAAKLAYNPQALNYFESYEVIAEFKFNLYLYLAVTGSLAIIFLIALLKIINKGDEIVPSMAITSGVATLTLIVIATIIGNLFFKNQLDIVLSCGKNTFASEEDYFYSFLAITRTVMSIIVFACAPILYGLDKLFKNRSTVAGKIITDIKPAYGRSSIRLTRLIKIILGVLAIIGIVISLKLMISAKEALYNDDERLLVNVTNSEKWYIYFGYLVAVVCLFMVVAVVVLNVIGRGTKFVPHIAILCGIVAVALSIVSVCKGNLYLSFIKEAVLNRTSVNNLYHLERYLLLVADIVINFLVFACTPILYGVRGLLKNNEHKLEAKP